MELDFIRGIAILLVMDFHAPISIWLAPFGWLGFRNFGWAGVDIFFVLSGFLVGGLLVKEWKLSGRIDAKRFLIRRGFKIWPQYYVFILIMLVTGHRGLSSLWGNLLNIQNYVGGVAHTWTLAVEEHAYLLLAAALTLAAKGHVNLRKFFIGIMATSAVILVWRTFLAARGVDIFSRTDTRIVGILFGLLLAVLYHDRPAHFRRLQSRTPLWLGILAFALALFRLDPQQWWGPDVLYFSADAAGVALLFLLYKRTPGLQDRQRLFLYRPVAWIGLYSYGIYLWHISVIAPIDKFAGQIAAPWGRFFLATAPMVAGVGLGVIATKLIEFPALALRDRLYPRRIDSAAGIPALAETVGEIRTQPESVSGGSVGL
jgi:peptidoglycan/LPS O-acetylase OafA/YrhL